MAQQDYVSLLPKTVLAVPATLRSHTDTTRALPSVQAPMLGYWLAFPVVLVLIERVTRLTRGFLPRKARLEALDDGTVVITAEKPEGQRWRAQAGQYVSRWFPCDIVVRTCVGGRKS